MAPSPKINITAVMYPHADKVDELLHIVRNLIEAVHEKEPDVLVYNAIQGKDTEGQDEVVFIEQNKAALDAHIASKHYTDASAKLHQLCRKPANAHFGELVAGFSSRKE